MARLRSPTEIRLGWDGMVRDGFTTIEMPLSQRRTLIMEYGTAVGVNEILLHIITWIDLTNIMFSKGNWIPKCPYNVI